MATKWWLVAQNKKTTIWQANVTEDGVEYYFNTETLEKTFDKPEELMTDAELKNSKSRIDTFEITTRKRPDIGGRNAPSSVNRAAGGKIRKSEPAPH